MRAPTKAATAFIILTCTLLPGCLLNSVHSISNVQPTSISADRAIVIVGVGLDVPSPFKEFAISLDEYSEKGQKITGNCFHYNRIELRRPTEIAKVSYFAYDVPAGTYVYSGFNANAVLRASTFGNGFIAPAGRAVYFGDYVLVGNAEVEIRRDIDAARASIKLPRNMNMEVAASTTTPPPLMFLCTP